MREGQAPSTRLPPVLSPVFLSLQAPGVSPTLILQPITDEYIDSLRGILGDTSDMIEQLRRDHLSEDK